MEIRFYTDADTGLPHILGHGITEADVEYVIRHPGDDSPIRNRARECLGKTPSGRYIRVIYVPDDDGLGLFVVTAYRLEGKPLTAFRRRQRRKGK